MLQSLARVRRLGPLAGAVVVALLAAGAAPRPQATRGKRAPTRSAKARPAKQPAKTQPSGPAAIIVSAPPGARVLRAGKPYKGALKGLALRTGDRVKTGKGGSVDIAVAAQGVVRLRPLSSLQVKTPPRVSRKDPETIDTRLRIDAGTLFTRLSRLRGKSRFIVETPSAVTAARGTAYAVQAGASRTSVLVAEGVVGVSLPGREREAVAVSADQKLVVAARSLPRAPSPVTEADRKPLAEVQKLRLPVIDLLEGWSGEVGWFRIWVPGGNIGQVFRVPDPAQPRLTQVTIYLKVESGAAISGRLRLYAWTPEQTVGNPLFVSEGFTVSANGEFNRFDVSVPALRLRPDASYVLIWSHEGGGNGVLSAWRDGNPYKEGYLVFRGGEPGEFGTPWGAPTYPDRDLAVRLIFRY